MILLIDNYDSFSYNLYQMIGTVSAGAANDGVPKHGTTAGRVGTRSATDVIPGQGGRVGGSEPAMRPARSGTPGGGSEPIRVIRNDEMSVAQIRELNPSRIILSPGPGRPEDAGILVEVARDLGKHVPILGVCLGHQAITLAYGGRVIKARELVHGKAADVRVDTSNPLFAGLPPIIQAGRYHSLAADASTLPESLRVIARADDGEIMGVAHASRPVYGIQFHPESILTPLGAQIIRNFLGVSAAPLTPGVTKGTAGVTKGTGTSGSRSEPEVPVPFVTPAGTHPSNPE